jgi:protein-S-isoprenylcysteine O-methyltransferase Ste14
MKKIRFWIDFVLYPLVVLLALLFGPRDLLWAAGLSFSLLSALFWFLARRQLGESFSVEAEARQLVTHGLYSKIRHPVYLFGDLAYFGALLALRAWIGLLLWLLVVFQDFRRARREDLVLAQAFGAEYQAYKAKTWF